MNIKDMKSHNPEPTCYGNHVWEDDGRESSPTDSPIKIYQISKYTNPKNFLETILSSITNFSSKDFAVKSDP